MLTTAAALLAPALLILPAFVPDAIANRHGPRAAALGAGLALGSFAFALLAAVGVFLNGPSSHVLLGFGPVSFSVYVDTISVVMLVLVSFLAAVIARYARPYLDADPDQGRFTRLLCLAAGSILLLVIAGNLILFTLAWTASSIALHHLLLFRPDRPGAAPAAWKKFVISRLGDVCLLGAIFLVWKTFGTWEFPELFARAAELGKDPASVPASLLWTALLLVAGAMMKSAQFPFHTWLPETMETPTPVSALMHAGIINAGGFLIIRLSPLVVLAPPALDLLAIAGAFTALFASVVMLSQTNIKRSLAWSTVAQMGFMTLQCGLGAFALALLHIVAHSLYKAHAFLSSGSIVQGQRKVPFQAHPLALFAAIGLSSAAVFGLSHLIHPHTPSGLASLVLGAVLALALAHLLTRLWGASPNFVRVCGGVLATTSVAAASLALHAATAGLLAASLPAHEPQHSLPGQVGIILILLLFLALLIFQTAITRLAHRPWLQAFYIHATNGFYLSPHLRRLLPSPR